MAPTCSAAGGRRRSMVVPSSCLAAVILVGMAVGAAALSAPAPAPGPSSAMLTAGACTNTLMDYVSSGDNAGKFTYLVQILEAGDLDYILEDTTTPKTMFLPLDSGIDVQLKKYGLDFGLLLLVPKATIVELVNYHTLAQPIPTLTSGTYPTLVPDTQLTVDATNPSNVSVAAAANTVFTPSATGTKLCSIVVYPISGVLISPSLAIIAGR